MKEIFVLTTFFSVDGTVDTRVFVSDEEIRNTAKLDLMEAYADVPEEEERDKNLELVSSWNGKDLRIFLDYGDLHLHKHVLKDNRFINNSFL